MSKLMKISIGIGVSLIIVLIALFVFLRHLVVKSFPITEGTIEVIGLHAPVNIYRDDYGVPHIAAKDDHDLMYAIGYVHAQDRLWQMDLIRRAGQGKLSEILDTATIKFDMLFRTLNLVSLAESLYLHLHPTSRRLLDDYTEGVNEFIATHKGKYPIEFDMMNYEPEPWKAQHSLLVARLMAWELNFAWWIDLTYAEIATLVSNEKFREIFISSPESQSPKLAVDNKPTQLDCIHNYLQTVKNYREYFGKGSFSGGSNAWVINSSKSMSGKTILANDPHLLISLPSKWYELHISAPGWNVVGVSVPGIPLVVIGHTDSIAWGFTNAMLDDCDFYFEEEDTLNANNYVFKNKSIPIRSREEIVYIGSSDRIEFTARSTHHGPVINDVHPISKHDHRNSIHEKSIITMRWLGYDYSDEILGFYRINRSRNKIEFENGLKELAVPAQCAVYADAGGNIGWWLAGKVPIRGKYNGTLPYDGELGDDEWQGFVPFDELPKAWNPSDGLIILANQEIRDGKFPYYLSTLWEPSLRYERIRDLLSIEKISVQDFLQFQQDVMSYYSKFLTENILQVYNADLTSDPSVAAALVYLHNWNFRCIPTDIASTIVNKYFVKLIHNIYEDELGKDVFHDFIYSLAPVYRVTFQLLQSKSSTWFDNVKTDTMETKEMIIRKSFLEAIDELKATFGNEMKTWQWGKIHQVLFEHPLGRYKPLDKVFNVGPFPVGGSEQTINKGVFKLTDPFFLFAAPSMRQVVDMAKPTSSYAVITLGQSGQPLHKHYDDQVSLWLNGGYRETTIDWIEIRNQKWEHLILEPKKL